MGHLEVIGGKGIIPDGATELEHAFFDSSCLESIEIPDSVTTIGESAFYGCTSLKSIKIPNSVIEINRHAFYHCI